METIHYLLGKIVKTVIVLFLMVFVLAVVSYASPNLQPSKLLNFSVFKGEWLPAPKNYAKERMQPDENGYYGTIYASGQQFNGYGNSASNPYITYSYNGEMPTSTRPGTPMPGTTHSDRSRYIRNLSLYEGENITYGQTIYGEARSDMFKNGIFPIVIADGAGKPISSMYAMNLGTWSVPGWLRWKAVVPIQLPRNIPCVLVFLSADGSRVGLPVRCN